MLFWCDHCKNLKNGVWIARTVHYSQIQLKLVNDLNKKTTMSSCKVIKIINLPFQIWQRPHIFTIISLFWYHCDCWLVYPLSISKQCQSSSRMHLKEVFSYYIDYNWFFLHRSATACPESLPQKWNKMPMPAERGHHNMHLIAHNRRTKSNKETEHNRSFMYDCTYHGKKIGSRCKPAKSMSAVS